MLPIAWFASGSKKMSRWRSGMTLYGQLRRPWRSREVLMLDVAKCAREVGFDHVALIDPGMVVTSKELSEACNPQSCQRYGTCWTCPPGAGAFEDIQVNIRSKNAGVLVQTVRDDVDFYEDWDVLAETRQLHNSRLDRLAAMLRTEFAGVLAFSTGGCDVCDSCSYPDAPCKQPVEQRLSLSAHGVAVGTTCQNVGMDYSFQNGRIRYVGMVLYE